MRVESELPTPQQTDRQKWLVTASVAITIVLLLAYAFRSQRPLEEASAPEFALSLFDGGKISLADHSGRVVVVNFWASWCAPCREEAPVLENLWRAQSDNGLVLLGVNIKDATANALAFLDEFGITYPNGPDPYGRIAGMFHVRLVPETFIIDKDGKIVERFVGAVVEDELRAALQGLLQR